MCLAHSINHPLINNHKHNNPMNLNNDNTINININNKAMLNAQLLDEVLALITSAVVYLLKVRLPLTDQLARWGYAPRVVNLLKRAQDVGALGSPSVSALRLLHQVGITAE